MRTVRWTRRSVLVIAALALVGCSIFQTVYHQAPKYVLWRANVAHHYDEFQYEQVRTHIRQWFDWQRTQQMPLVARFLARARMEVLGTVTPALACERRDEIEQWMREGIDQAAPRAAQLALTLSPRQVQHLEGFFRDKNEDFVDDFLPESPQERALRAAGFVTKWSSLFYGSFSEEQRAALAADIARLPFDSATILREFQRFQTGYVKLVREAQAQRWTAEQTSVRMKALLLDGIDPQDPARRADMQRWIQAGCQAGAAFHNRTTVAQRTRAAERFATWQQDAIELSKEP